MDWCRLNRDCYKNLMWNFFFFFIVVDFFLVIFMDMLFRSEGCDDLGVVLNICGRVKIEVYG